MVDRENLPEDPYDDSRPRGMLSPVDRKWLKGTKEYEYRQAEDKRKREVHERIRNALFDLELLSNHPDKIEDDRIYVGGGILGTRADGATVPGIGFLLRHRIRDFCEYDGEDDDTPRKIHDEALEAALNKDLAAAIRHSLRVECGWRQDQHAIGLGDFDVDVDVDIEYLDPRPDHVVELDRGIEDGTITSERLLRVRDEVQIDIFHFDDLLKKIYSS
jgi:hypothetical protein